MWLLCRYFTWDKTKFPQPEEMIGGLAGVGRKLVNIVDPHVKVDSGYSVYQECKDKDLFVKDKSGNEFNGWCWPGNSAYADFLNPAAREWFADQYKFDKYAGETCNTVQQGNSKCKKTRLDGFQGCHENALNESCEMSPHLGLG